MVAACIEVTGWPPVFQEYRSIRSTLLCVNGALSVAVIVRFARVTRKRCEFGVDHQIAGKRCVFVSGESDARNSMTGGDGVGVGEGLAAEGDAAKAAQIDHAQMHIAIVSRANPHVTGLFLKVKFLILNCGSERLLF